MKNIITYFFVISIFLSNISYPQSFTKILTGPVANDSGWCYGCCWADFNNDGYQDLFVVNNMTGNKNNLLYMNNGNGTFTKVTTGIVVTDGGSSYGCTCADYDNDGFIDIFVANYNENNFLYHNNGNGTFSKITTGAIVTNNSNSGGCAWADYDNDGYPDLFVANAGPAADFLYHNNGNGTFTQITNDPIVLDVLNSSGGSWGDYNNDGYLDLFVTGGVIGTGYDRLFRNNGNGTFTKITSDPIVTYSHWSGGSSWGDFNKDGYLDMFVGGYDGINLLFVNNGNGTFTRIDTGIIVTDGNYKMGSSWCDYDNDGNLDLFVARNNYFGGNNCLYHNEGNNNKWLNIKCIGMVSNKAGIGARLYLKAVINGNAVTQMREISCQTGGAISGQNMLNAFFGLGNATIIDSLKIIWPSGIIDRYGQIQTNRFITAIEGQGISNIKSFVNNIPEDFKLFQNYPNPFNPGTIIGYSLPVNSYVQLKVYDITGREITTLVNEFQKAGNYETQFPNNKYSNNQLPSGIYFYKLTAGDFSKVMKMTLIK